MLVTYCRIDLAIRLPVNSSSPLIRAHAARWGPSTSSSKFDIYAVLRNTEKQQSTRVDYCSHQGHRSLSLMLRRSRVRSIVHAAHLQFQCTVIPKNHICGYIEVTTFHLSAS